LATTDPARARQQKKKKHHHRDHVKKDHIFDSEAGMSHVADDDDVYTEWEMVHVEEMNTITCHERDYVCCSLCPYTPPAASHIEPSRVRSYHPQLSSSICSRYASSFSLSYCPVSV
jgi:hypothetical protein